MADKYLVVGHFKFLDDTQRAIEGLRDSNREYKVYSPFPSHDLEDTVYEGKKRSPVRMFTLLGGLLGLSGAFLMTIWMSMDYPLRTSAKPIISIPPFVIIAFECTILLGAIITLLSMFHFSKVPHWFYSTRGYRPNFSKDTFGVVATVGKSETDSFKEKFLSQGAHEVEIQYVR